MILVAGLVVLGLDRLFFLDITKMGWRRAARDLPEFAAKMGLHFLQGKFDYEIGEIRGTFHGRPIAVMPDDQASIDVTLLGRLEIQMGTYQSRLRHPPEGWIDFASGGQYIDDFFKTRLASPEAIRLHSLWAGSLTQNIRLR